MGALNENAATWASAWTPASVRPEPSTTWRFSDFGEDGFEDALDSGQAGLDLPAVVIGAVVGEGQLPGLDAGVGLGAEAGLRF